MSASASTSADCSKPSRRPASRRPPAQTAAYPLLSGEVTEILLVGAGDGSAKDLRHAGAAIARFGRGKDELTAVVAEGIDDAALQAFAEGVVLGSFTYT